MYLLIVDSRFYLCFLLPGFLIAWYLPVFHRLITWVCLPVFACAYPSSFYMYLPVFIQVLLVFVCVHPGCLLRLLLAVLAGYYYSCVNCLHFCI